MPTRGTRRSKKAPKQSGGNLTDKIKDHMALLDAALHDKSITPEFFEKWKKTLLTIFHKGKRTLSKHHTVKKNSIDTLLDHWLHKLVTDRLDIRSLTSIKNKIDKIIDDIERKNVGMNDGNEHVKNVGPVHPNAFHINSDVDELEALINKLFNVLYKKMKPVSVESYAELLRAYLSNRSDLLEEYEPLREFIEYVPTEVPAQKLIDALSIVLKRKDYVPKEYIEILQAELAALRDQIVMDGSLNAFVRHDPSTVTRQQLEPILFKINGKLFDKKTSIHMSAMKNLEPLGIVRGPGKITRGSIVNND